jgi:hypothetical protein
MWVGICSLSNMANSMGEDGVIRSNSFILIFSSIIALVLFVIGYLVKQFKKRGLQNEKLDK